MTCQTCMHWNLKLQPNMSRYGFGTCNLEANKWVYYPLQHTCDQHRQATAEIVLNRETFFKDK